MTTILLIIAVCALGIYCGYLHKQIKELILMKNYQPLLNRNLREFIEKEEEDRLGDTAYLCSEIDKLRKDIKGLCQERKDLRRDDENLLMSHVNC